MRHRDQWSCVDHRYVAVGHNANGNDRYYPYKENCQISNGALAISHPTHGRIEVLLPNHRELSSGRHDVADSAQKDLVSGHFDANHEGSSDYARNPCDRRIALDAFTAM